MTSMCIMYTSLYIGQLEDQPHPLVLAPQTVHSTTGSKLQSSVLQVVNYSLDKIYHKFSCNILARQNNRDITSIR